MNGQHIITMNGIYYGLNADCQYLLAGDFENSNFTVIAGVRKEKLSTLAISSNFQTIVLTADGAVSTMSFMFSTDFVGKSGVLNRNSKIAEEKR